MPDPTPSPNPPDAFDEIVEEDNRSLAAQLIVIGVLVLVFATLLVISKLF